MRSFQRQKTKVFITSRPEQELGLLRRVDPQQRQDGRLRHPAPRPQDGLHLHRQLHCHPGVSLIKPFFSQELTNIRLGRKGLSEARTYLNGAPFKCSPLE